MAFFPITLSYTTSYANSHHNAYPFPYCHAYPYPPLQPYLHSNGHSYDANSYTWPYALRRLNRNRARQGRVGDLERVTG